jgi:hypothetical protein
MARIFNAVRAENTPPRHARGDVKQALRREIWAKHGPMDKISASCYKIVNLFPSGCGTLI